MMEFKNYNDYQNYMDNNYNEDKQIIIENFISYYLNKLRGFGHYNCEYTYQKDLINDINHELHEFAIIGYNL